MTASFAQLLSDRKGNVAIVAALMLPVFVATMATAVDLVNLYSAKRDLQQALDAAALAAAKEFGKTQDDTELQKWASTYFEGNAGGGSFGDTHFIYGGVSIVNDETIMKVSATRDVPTYFGHLLEAMVGKKSWRLDVASEIAVQNRSIEMVLVLDNSGSMKDFPAGGSKKKIETLKEAATTLIGQMMPPDNGVSNSNLEDPVSMAVVPFSGAVNIGADNADAAWMDTKGLSPIHHENLDWSTWASAKPGLNKTWKHKDTDEYLTRFYLFSHASTAKTERVCKWEYPQLCFTIFNKEYCTQLTPREVCQNTVTTLPLEKEGWKGCVEARPEGLAITDAAPQESDPRSLFVPLFAPDEYQWTGNGSSSAKNDYLKDGSEGQEASGKTAFAFQSKASKYLSGTASSVSSAGPNFICNTTPVTSLSNNKATIAAAVEAMVAEGSTNIPEGLAWGWRVLSERAPFTEGRAADEEDNLKVIVLMTDGENTYNPNYLVSGQAVDINNANKSMFGPFGYGQTWKNGLSHPGRIFDAVSKTPKTAAADNYVSAMNEMTAQVCQNIKNDGKQHKADGNDGIIVFTIAFDLKDGTPVKKLMEDCASNGIIDPTKKLYYDAESADQLVKAFGAITQEISNLRIAR